MTLHTLASGSEGNCLLVASGSTRLLVDAGISLRRIKTALAQLGLTVDQLSGILLTHSHADHVAALQTLVKHHTVPIYASYDTAQSLCKRVAGLAPLLRTVERSTVFPLGDCRITVFPTSHDAPGSVDYRIDGTEGSVGVLTDTGYVTQRAAEALEGVELLVLESNHDPDWLRSGPYPYHLKQRILGEEGHLSNEDAAHFAAQMARCGTQQIVLAHLSRENNTPARALETVQRHMAAEDLGHVRITVAPRGELSEAYRTEGQLCRK